MSKSKRKKKIGKGIGKLAKPCKLRIEPVEYFYKDTIEKTLYSL